MTNDQRHKEFNPQGSIEVAVAIDKTINSFGSCGTCEHRQGCRTFIYVTDTQKRNSLDFYCADYLKETK